MQAAVRAGERSCRLFVFLGWVLGAAFFAAQPLHAQVSPDSVRALYRRGRADQAEPLVRAALTRVFARTHADSLVRAEWADLLAEAQWRLRRRTSQADSIADAAVAGRLRLHGADSEPYALSLANQARLWRSSRSADSCVAGLQRALARLERVAPESRLAQADILVSLGNAQRESRAFESAVTALERATDLRRQALGPMDRDVARALLNLGLAYGALGNAQRRIDVERQAIDILERVVPLDSLALYYTCRNLTGSLYQLHRPLEAAPYVARCLQLGAELMAPMSQDAADDEENAGFYQVYAGDRASARRHFDRAATIYASRTPGLLATSEARCLLNRSVLEAADGRLDSAQSCADRGCAELERVFRAQPNAGSAGGLAAALDRAGQVLAARGQLAEAAGRFRVAAGLYEEYAAAEHPDRAALLAELAAMQMRAGHLDSVAVPGLRAAAALTRHVRREFSTMSESEALASRSRGARPVLQVLLSLLCTPQSASVVDSVWSAYVDDRGVVLAELSARRDLLHATVGTGADTLVRALADARARLGRAELRTREGGEVARLRARTLQLEQQVAVGNARLAGDFARARTGAREIPAALPARTALVHYVRFVRSGLSSSGSDARMSDALEFPVLGSAVPWYAAFVLCSGDLQPRFVSLGAAAEIEPALATWQAMLSRGDSPTSRERQAGRRVRERVWDPIARELAATDLVLIVPDGPLALLPFATLPTRGGQPLLEQGPTLHVLEEAQSVAKSPGPASSGRAVLVGGVDHGAPPMATARGGKSGSRVRGFSSRCEEIDLPVFEPLPGTVDELRFAGESWRSARARDPEVLSGRSATEAIWRERTPGAELIHLATHGFYLPDSCPARVTGTEVLFADLRAVSPTPGAGEVLLRTGVVLAGANAPGPDPHDDGILTAADIAMLDLSAARLVVLSACETGQGVVSDAEGVLGLRSALRQAGARASITSLHRVGDDATARWMSLFYRAWLTRGGRLAEATRSASRELRRELRAREGRDRPGVWGAFVSAGDWR